MVILLKIIKPHSIKLKLFHPSLKEKCLILDELVSIKMVLGGIDIAYYLAEIEKIIGACQGNLNCILHKLIKPTLELAEELRREIESKEDLAKIGSQAPLLEPYNLELRMWAMSILVSAWVSWVFTAKANNPKYRSKRPEASINAQKVLPYIKNIIMSAVDAGKEIGSNPQSNYRPENIKKLIQL